MKEISNKFYQRELTEVMNIWKSYMRTAGWRIIWKKIIAVIDATFAVAEKEAWKKKSRTGLNFFRFAFRNCKSCVYNYHDLLSYKRTNYNTSLVIFTGKALKLEKHGAIFVKFQSHIRSCHPLQRVQQTTGNNILLHYQNWVFICGIHLNRFSSLKDSNAWHSPFLVPISHLLRQWEELWNGEDS